MVGFLFGPDDIIVLLILAVPLTFATLVGWAVAHEIRRARRPRKPAG